MCTVICFGTLPIHPLSSKTVTTVRDPHGSITGPNDTVYRIIAMLQVKN